MKLNLSMKEAKIWLMVLFTLCLSFSTSVRAKGVDFTYNRFNVVFVVDASSSMDYNDPTHLRYEAISQFVYLLADEGNFIGGVVFSDDIAGEQDLIAANSQDSKNQVVQAIQKATTAQENLQTPDGLRYTNIGIALETAVDMLENDGESELPSVIVFLSDGNTEMPTEEEYETSLEKKADALQRAREDGISIYTVCLNANNRSDFSEMEQISSATGGVAHEVSSADDLQAVFNEFYDLIYSTSTIELIHGIFPESGRLETKFDVPGFGVEEVNIIIYGLTDKIFLLDPNKEESKNVSMNNFDSFTLVKLSDVLPGTWTLVTEGISGNSIKINMVYNTNLGVIVTSNPSSDRITEGDSFQIIAALVENGEVAANEEQYVGYEAELQILDAYGDMLESVPMKITNDHFEVDYDFGIGSYFYQVKVIGNYLETVSEEIGPLTVVEYVEAESDESSHNTETKPINTEPIAVKNSVEDVVYIWPFKGGVYTLDLSTLATDAEDDNLRYKIISSSFIEGTDYHVDDDILTLDHFSLKKGAFTVKATDSGGLSCEIEVIVKSRNVGTMTLIVLSIIGAFVLIGLGIGTYILLNKPFYGTTQVRSQVDGITKGSQITKRRGHILLSAFNVDNIGIPASQCKIQATGKKYVIFQSKVPVFHEGNMVKSIRIEGNGREEIIRKNDQDTKFLKISFVSKLRK